MSNLTVSRLSGPAANSNQIVVPSGHHLIAPGHVLQVQVKRYDTPTSYSGAEMTDLRVSITPKSASSMILCMFQLSGEVNTYDNVFRIFKNGAVATGTYAGYNIYQGLQAWSGIAPAGVYETDFNSTGMVQTFFYHDFPGVTTALTYAPWVSAAFYMNRTVGSTGTTNHETGVSYAFAMEIGQ